MDDAPLAERDAGRTDGARAPSTGDPAMVISHEADDRVEVRLQRSERRFARIIESNADGIVVVGGGGVVRFMNRAAESLFGRQREELVGELFGFPLVSGEMTEIEIFHRTGMRYTVEMHVVEIDWEGEPARLASLRDVTDRIRTEEALKASEERYRNLFETSRDSIYMVKRDGRFVDFNPAFEVLFGYSKRDMDTITVYDLYENPADRQRFLEVIDRYGAVQGYDVRLKKRDGTPMDCLITSSVFMDDDGNVAGYQGIFRDVTERKNIERRLRDSLAELESALNGSIRLASVAVEKRDPYTAGHQQRVAHLSRAVAKKMGLARAQVEGIFMAGLIHDVGKISVPAEILAKPTRLTDNELNLIKMHPRVGHDILSGIMFPWPLADIVLQHHEKMDGTGYPRGLSGEDIFMEARVICVADVVEAMASDRPYRAGLGVDIAMEEITRGRGTAYDPMVVDSCVELFERDGFRFDR